MSVIFRRSARRRVATVVTKSAMGGPCLAERAVRNPCNVEAAVHMRTTFVGLVLLLGVVPPPRHAQAAPSPAAKRVAQLSAVWARLERGLRYPVRGCSDAVKWVCAADAFVESANGRPKIQGCRRRVAATWKSKGAWNDATCKGMMSALIESVRAATGQKLSGRAALRKIVAPILLAEVTEQTRAAVVGHVQAVIDQCVADTARRESTRPGYKPDPAFTKRLGRALQPQLKDLRKMLDPTAFPEGAQRDLIEQNWRRAAAQVCTGVAAACRFDAECDKDVGVGR